jgi:hypothetical protein
VVWEYVSPYFGQRDVSGDPSLLAQGEQNSIFRAFRYTREEIPWL